jgi:hypothetical protein
MFSETNCISAWLEKTVAILAMGVVLMLGLPAWSQGNLGRILGVVTDQSGSIVAGATVTVLDGCANPDGHSDALGGWRVLSSLRHPQSKQADAP